jgi:hypothetical protein
MCKVIKERQLEYREKKASGRSMEDEDDLGMCTFIIGHRGAELNNTFMNIHRSQKENCLFGSFAQSE